MKKRIIATLILINIGCLLVGCKSVEESKNNVNVNAEENNTEISEEEKTIIEAQRLCDTGNYEETMNYIETVIFANGSNYSEEQQKKVDKILEEISKFYVPPVLNLTKEEAVSSVINHDDVVYFDYTGGESYNDIVPTVTDYSVGNKTGYKIHVSIPINEWYSTYIGTYFVDSSNGDIYKKNDSGRFEILK